MGRQPVDPRGAGPGRPKGAVAPGGRLDRSSPHQLPLWGRCLGLGFGIEAGLEGGIDLTGAGQELLHGRQQLLFQESNFFLTVGMVDPGACDRLAVVRTQDLEQGPVAGLDQGDRIFPGEGIESGGHELWRR